MKIRTFSWLAALALVSSATLSAQVAGESQTPAETPVMLEEAAVPAPVEVQATATVETVVPTPEAGAVQAPAMVEATAEVKADSDADAIIIEREGAPSEMETASELAASSEEEGLPKTASPLALLGLLGLGSSGTALGVRFARKRR